MSQVSIWIKNENKESDIWLNVLSLFAGCNFIIIIPNFMLDFKYGEGYKILMVCSLEAQLLTNLS